METDTAPCESCEGAGRGNVPRVWGYNDCQTCVDEQQRCQQAGLLDYDFYASEPERDKPRAATLLCNLQQMFDRRVSSRKDLRDATQMLYRLEGLRIHPASAAYQELDRLRAIWKHRLSAQDDIDRWMIRHGHPVC
jgi:hypothetical protein